MSDIMAKARHSLRAYLGCWGIKTSRLEADADLCWVAGMVYGIEATDIISMSSQIASMSKKARKARAAEGMARHAAELALFMDETEPGAPKTVAEIVGENPVLNDDGKDLRDLLRQVVVAVINHGRGDILWEFPDVLAHFGGQIPDGYAVRRDPKSGRNEMIRLDS
jgi:hypothetical protein